MHTENSRLALHFYLLFGSGEHCFEICDNQYIALINTTHGDCAELLSQPAFGGNSTRSLLTCLRNFDLLIKSTIYGVKFIFLKDYSVPCTMRQHVAMRGQ